MSIANQKHFRIQDLPQMLSSDLDPQDLFLMTDIDNNDIMWNGNKIAGSAFYQTPNSNIFYMSLCLVDHSHEIEILCGKNAKVPGYLTGITKIEIENEVNAWLRPTI